MLDIAAGLRTLALPVLALDLHAHSRSPTKALPSATVLQMIPSPRRAAAPMAVGATTQLHTRHRGGLVYIGTAGIGAGLSCTFQFTYEGAVYYVCTLIVWGTARGGTSRAWGDCAASCPILRQVCVTVGGVGAGTGHPCAVTLNVD